MVRDFLLRYLNQMENPYSTAAVIIGITQIAKMNGVPSRILPIIAAILGGIIHPAVSNDFTIPNVFYGVFLGLTTTGLINFGVDKIKKITSNG